MVAGNQTSLEEPFPPMYNIGHKSNRLTAMGNDNVGGLTLKYGLEDTDYIGDRAVYNAHDSVFFCNVRDYFPDRLSEMFLRMEAKDAWNAQRLLDEMDAYQSIKPERLWVADMRRKYLRPHEDKNIQNFLSMMHGTKTLQRAQFELYQEKYCASKYISPKCKEDQITVRSYVKTISTGFQPITLNLTMYADCYIAVQLGSNYVHQRVTGGVPTSITYTASSLNDTETYIYTASQVQAIGNLSELRIGYSDFSRATKLQSLIVSPYDASYTNTNLNDIGLGNCALLKNLEICGCPNLNKALSFSGCPRLENVDLRNTSVTGVSFANGGYLESAKLPDTVKTITAIRLGDWMSLEMQGYQNIETLRLENCEKLNSRELVERSEKLSRLRILGIDWTMNNSQLLIDLAKIGGIDALGGYINQAVITGKALINYLSDSRLTMLEKLYPELEVTRANRADEYTVRFWNDAEIVDEQIVEAGLAAEDPLTWMDAPVRASTPYYVFTFIGWDQTFISILKDTDIHATYSQADRTYSVRWLNGYDVLDEQIVVAGQSALYSGQTLPATLDKIWTGFDSVAENILIDTDINATWMPIEPAPSSKPTEYDFVYSDDPADKSAYTLGQFAGIIQAGLAKEYFSEYDRIKIVPDTEVVTDSSIIMSLHSTGHYRLEDGKDLAKTTWYMVGLLNNNRQVSKYSTNIGGYFSTDIDQWLEHELFACLPYHWQSMIKPVIVLATAGGQSDTINSAVRHMYLPSIAELGLSTKFPYNQEVDEEAALTELNFSMYPVSTATQANNQRKKGKYNNTGEPAYYWTRSAYDQNNEAFYCITNYGAATYIWPTNEYGICVGCSM